ncbi:oxidoreductase [Salinarchaeum sp. Harcht-Bsk1]|uniref:Gfo/Idh/MocA family protein n=1 Tax=Salinarchaeum sp. Harcht-Bsk1 TaxID=1333523 RepID=UPI0003424448|nr:Gfo/Idh/MocA family oxidoreductase [Salinarchaeum sp. Harcht-Bsk1]AGN00178.1 oxidoreductase [Salinarchaeum sp. Harcht-Bsk1]
MDQDTPRIGFVGLGNMARHHVDNLLDQDVEIAAGVDVVPEAREAFADDFGAETFEDVDAMCEVVDAAFVVTPNRFHEDAAVTILENDVALYQEKPLAHTLESAERIANAAADSDAIAMVGLHNRFNGGAEVLDAYRQEGRFGDVSHVEIEYVRRRGIPAIGTWFTDKSTAGGGSLIDIGVHAIDLGLHLAGHPDVVEVSGTARSEFGDRDDTADMDIWGTPDPDGVFDVDDSASAFFRGDDGTTFSLEVAWASNREPAQSVTVRGDDGGATLDLSSGETTIYEDGTAGIDHVSDAAIETKSRDAHAACQRAFLEGLRTGEQPERNTVEQALTVQQVIDGIYRSSEADAAVRLDE